MSEWQRVNQNKPCQICHKPTWCAVSATTGLSLCMRVASDRQVQGGGWLHGTGNGSPPPQKRQPTVDYEAPCFDCQLWYETVRRVANIDKLKPWADQLGLPVDALDIMGAGVVGEMLTFPMYDGHGKPCGVRTRTLSGDKKALLGSRAGVFLPAFGPDSDVVVCEGPTDATAALALGFWPIGRPSCLGCERHVVDTLKRFSVFKATICADADGPGLAGARKLADVLRACKVQVRIVTPGHCKDLRDWYKLKVVRGIVETTWSQAEWR